MKTLCMQHGSVWLTEQETESSWSQLEHRFDDWFSSSTVSSVDEPSPKSIFSRANPLASNCWHLTAAYSRHSRGLFCLFLNQAALTSMASWSTLQYLVLPRFKVGTQSLLNLSRSSALSSWLKMPSADSFVLQYILSLYIVATYYQNTPFSSLSAQFFSFFSLFINNRRYPEKPYSHVFSAVTWTISNNTVNHDIICSTCMKWCGLICFIYIHATPTWWIVTVIKQLVTWMKTKNYGTVCGNIPRIMWRMFFLISGFKRYRTPSTFTGRMLLPPFPSHTPFYTNIFFNPLAPKIVFRNLLTACHTMIMI